MTRGKIKYISLVLAALLFIPRAEAATVTLHPVVAELFTSQGCSSCPPADTLLKQMADAYPGMLALSYHVNYWDHLGWKDPFSLQGSTDRQRGYYNALQQTSFYTPELVVNGATSMIGSDENRVAASLANDKIDPSFSIQIAPEGKQHQLGVTVSAANAANATAEAWEVTYIPYAKTGVSAGENDGRTLENINNVVMVKRLGTLTTGAGHYRLQESSHHDMIAVIVQGENQGPILAAATYQP